MGKFTSKSIIQIFCAFVSLLMAAGCGDDTPTATPPNVGLGLGLFGVVTTIAGSGFSGSTDGQGPVASFDDPVGITTDGSSLYIADTYNNKIRVVGIASGLVSTLAGSGIEGDTDDTGALASFDSPAGITTDGTFLYVADTENNAIREINIASGVVTTFAGSGNAGYQDGFGTSASFSRPTGITTDGTSLYVSDTGNNVIRQISLATGQVTTLAGSGDSGYMNGAAADATFDTPSGIATDSVNLYIADAQNNMIRQVVIATGAVTTLAGSGAPGTTDSVGTQASFWYPEGLTTDGTFVYVADTQNDTIREVAIATGSVVTLAGAWAPGLLDGAGTAAYMREPIGMTTDGISLYFADTGNKVIRRVQ